MASFLRPNILALLFGLLSLVELGSAGEYVRGTVTVTLVGIKAPKFKIAAGIFNYLLAFAARTYCKDQGDNCDSAYVEVNDVTAVNLGQGVEVDITLKCIVPDLIEKAITSKYFFGLSKSLGIIEVELGDFRVQERGTDDEKCPKNQEPDLLGKAAVELRTFAIDTDNWEGATKEGIDGEEYVFADVYKSYLEIMTGSPNVTIDDISPAPPELFYEEPVSNNPPPDIVGVVGEPQPPSSPPPLPPSPLPTVTKQIFIKFTARNPDKNATQELMGEVHRRGGGSCVDDPSSPGFQCENPLDPFFPELITLDLESASQRLCITVATCLALVVAFLLTMA